MDISNVKELIKAVSESDLTSFQVKEDNLEIILSKNDCQTSLLDNSVENTSKEINKSNLEIGNESKDATNLEVAVKDEVKAEVKTPLVGTVYLAPAEGEEPFVKVGDTVKDGQVVAIVEAMKLMNEISCDKSGTISEILVENGQLVEYGQPLFTIA